MEESPMVAPQEASAAGDTFYFASIGRRFVALLLDGFILGLISIPFAFFPAAMTTSTTATYSGDAMMGSAFIFAAFFKIVLAAVYSVFFTGHFGQTPGKMIMKIKVVTYDGAIPGYAVALVRYLVSIVSSAVFLIGYLWAFFNKEHQTWHDMVAKTYVVKS
jgi:uncharacterized RDD family membrane protein YckC